MPAGKKVTLNVRNTVMLTKMEMLERQNQEKASQIAVEDQSVIG